MDYGPVPLFLERKPKSGRGKAVSGQGSALKFGVVVNSNALQVRLVVPQRYQGPAVKMVTIQLACMTIKYCGRLRRPQVFQKGGQVLPTVINVR